MRVNRFNLAMAASMLLLATQAAFGAGFALYEGSTKGNVTGGLTGGADDAAAVFYNPAAITQLEGSHFMGGVSLIAPVADFKTTNIYAPDDGAKSAEFSKNVFTPPHVYYTRQLNDSLWLGAGFFSRFGLGTEYDRDWDGRYSNIDTLIETVTLNPNIAWKATEEFSLSFGAQFTYLDASLTQAIDGRRVMGEVPNDPRSNEFDSVQTIEDSAWGYGFNLGLHYKAERWSVGFQYISEIEIDLDNGTAHFTKPIAEVPSTWFVDTNVSAEPIDLPAFIMFGVNFQSHDNLTWTFGAIQTRWSSVKELAFNYDNPFIVAPGLGASLDRVVRELDWEDVWRYNLGVVWRRSEHLELFFGGIVDESPVPDSTVSFLLPSNDRQVVSAGFRYNMAHWTVDVGLDYIVLKDRSIAQRQVSEGVLAAEVTNGAAPILAFSLSRKL